MPLTAVAIDERTMQRGSDSRRAEWEANIRELLAKPVCDITSETTLRIELTEREFLLRFEADDDGSSKTIEVGHELLAEQITDYLDIVRQMTAADSLNQMEALDMAKKVTHDRAGRVLKRQLRELSFDLETSRRLFTLLLSLKVDTTRLPGLRGHPRTR